MLWMEVNTAAPIFFSAISFLGDKSISNTCPVHIGIPYLRLASLLSYSWGENSSGDLSPFCSLRWGVFRNLAICSFFVDKDLVASLEQLDILESWRKQELAAIAVLSVMAGEVLTACVDGQYRL